MSDKPFMLSIMIDRRCGSFAIFDTIDSLKKLLTPHFEKPQMPHFHNACYQYIFSNHSLAEDGFKQLKGALAFQDIAIFCYQRDNDISKFRLGCAPDEIVQLAIENYRQEYCGERMGLLSYNFNLEPKSIAAILRNPENVQIIQGEDF